MKLNIATLQLNPVIGHIEETILRANSLLKKSVEKSPIDLLVLPELAFTGYNFKDSTQIKPYLESVEEGGPSINWAKETSQKYGCCTVIGYPELSKGKIYNSAIVINKLGKVVHNYHKSFLYESDEAWGCVEGEGFQTFEVENVKCSIGICMDLNPYKFEAPFTDFEFSSFCLKNQVQLIICPMAWLSSKSPSLIKDRDNSQEITYWEGKFNEIKHNAGIIDFSNEFESTYYDDTEDEKPSLMNYSLKNLDYWVLRFFPFLNYINKRQVFSGKSTVVICNRSGLEKDIMYGGTSSILQFNGSKGVFGYTTYDTKNKSVDILGHLNRGGEGILVRQVEI